MNQACPNCNREETDLLSMAFYAEMVNLPAQGTRSAMDIVRLLLGIGPPFPKRCNGAESLLQKAAPPKKISYYPILTGWFLTTLALTVVPTTTGTLIGYGALVVALLLLSKAYNFNVRRWPILFEKWEHSYICRECGRVFEASEGTR